MCSELSKNDVCESKNLETLNVSNNYEQQKLFFQLQCRFFTHASTTYSWSQWPHGLRHEMSSLARILGLWVRIPLKAWMFFCVYSMFVFPCVGSSLAMAWSSVQGVLSTVLGLRHWSETKRFTDAYAPKWKQEEGEREGGGERITY
jgi:hypothetical protein